jgi:hypothetical protein
LAIPARPLPAFLDAPAAAPAPALATPGAAPGAAAAPGLPGLPDGASPLLRLLYGFANRRGAGQGNRNFAAGKYKNALANEFPLMSGLVSSIPTPPNP